MSEDGHHAVDARVIVWGSEGCQLVADAQPRALQARTDTGARKSCMTVTC